MALIGRSAQSVNDVASNISKSIRPTGDTYGMRDFQQLELLIFLAY